MGVTGDIPAQGTLTGGGTTDTLVTGSGSAMSISVSFYNYSGSAVTVTLYINGTADANAIGMVSIDANGGSCVVEDQLGSGDTFRAKASASSAITYTVRTTVLS